MKYNSNMKYAALLRGIGPGNPNMRNDKLREVFEGLRFNNVQTVISSGNVIFESDSKDIKSLENTIEEAIFHHLGFRSTTIIRSRQQLQELVDFNPFASLEHGPSSYLLVTFFKNPTKVSFNLPYQPDDKPYKFLSADKHTIFSTTDNTIIKTSDLMTYLEKQFSKEITSRTYKTVNRILDKMRKSRLTK